MTDNGDWVGIEFFAEIMGISIGHARKLCREGKAPRHIKVGRFIRFRRSDVIEWVEEHTVNKENE